MDIVFRCDSFAALPQVLCPKSEVSEINKSAALTVEEILVADLGDSYVEPHLLVTFALA